MTTESLAGCQLETSIKLLALVKRSAFVLAELPKSEQTPSVLALREKLVDAIKQHDPEYYGL